MRRQSVSFKKLSFKDDTHNAQRRATGSGIVAQSAEDSEQLSRVNSPGGINVKQKKQIVNKPRFTNNYMKVDKGERQKQIQNKMRFFKRNSEPHNAAAGNVVIAPQSQASSPRQLATSVAQTSYNTRFTTKRLSEDHSSTTGGPQVSSTLSQRRQSTSEQSKD